jgi:hypothetical protein
MFGVPIEGPANVFCDNNGVVKNMTIPESMLRRRIMLSITVRYVRQLPQKAYVRKEDGMTNLADLFTKVLTANWHRTLCCHIMY